VNNIYMTDFFFHVIMFDRIKLLFTLFGLNLSIVTFANDHYLHS